MNHPDDLPTEFEDVIRRMRDETPVPSPSDLDRMMPTVNAASPRPRRTGPAKGRLMNSRLAISFVLVLGLMVSGTGGALALSTGSTHHSAAQSQYCTASAQQAGLCGTQSVQGQTGTSPTGTPGGKVTTNTPTGLASPSTGTRGTAGVEGTSQAAATGSGKTLPFTGFAALPVILIGLAMLAGGSLAMRRLQRTE